MTHPPRREPRLSAYFSPITDADIAPADVTREMEAAVAREEAERLRARRMWLIAVTSVASAIAIVAFVLPRRGWALTAVFAFFTASVLLLFRQLRLERQIRQLRAFCRLVAQGDVGLKLPEFFTRDPGDVGQLARDMDAMRRGLAEQIGVDAMTGCLNRRALESRLRGERRLARRRGSAVSVVAVDLDRFKSINDTLGHDVGDVVLKQLSAIMRDVVRETDAVARLGGDEFVLVLPDTDAEGATVLAERLRARVAGTDFGPASAPLRLTISLGVAIAVGTDEIAVPELLKRADIALYRSKQQGRNVVSLGA